jgi:regulator of cell morphogenesis and NO signaling
MISATEKSTVGGVARSFPGSVRLFQQYGIDFCCGGNRSLGEACQEKGVSIEQFLADVERAQQSNVASETRDWDSATLSQLIDHILTKHHAYLRAELPRLAQMLAKVIEVHGTRHPESLPSLGKIYAGLKKELEEHMWKEENVLFPIIKKMEQAIRSGQVRAAPMSVRNPITVMEMEHESAGNALQQMRRLTAEYQPSDDACNTYRGLLDGLKTLEADLHQHIHLENNILFPRAIELEGD